MEAIAGRKPDRSSRHRVGCQSAQQIAMALRQGEAGTPVANIWRKLGISQATNCRWRKAYGSSGVSELRELRQLRSGFCVPGCPSHDGKIAPFGSSAVFRSWPEMRTRSLVCSAFRLAYLRRGNQGIYSCLNQKSINRFRN